MAVACMCTGRNSIHQSKPATVSTLVSMYKAPERVETDQNGPAGDLTYARREMSLPARHDAGDRPHLNPPAERVL
jgi:hypothetical protein